MSTHLKLWIASARHSFKRVKYLTEIHSDQRVKCCFLISYHITVHEIFERKKKTSLLLLVLKKIYISLLLLNSSIKMFVLKLIGFRKQNDT